MKTGSSLLIEDFEPGTYYFWIIAYNKTGSVWSNVIMIEIPLEELNNGGGEKPTPPDPFMIFMIIIGPVAGYSAYRVNHSRQEKSQAKNSQEN